MYTNIKRLTLIIKKIKTFRQDLSRKKSSQIEALRKKYEALLQEDQQRKQRNQYILEKMDKMRMSTTVAHYKPYYQESTMPLTNSNASQPGKALSFNLQSYRHIHQDMQKNPSSGPPTSLLQELHSKFILIPKLTSIQIPYIIPEQTQPNNNLSNIDSLLVNETDWTRKYDILNKLKQEEKEIPGEETKFESEANITESQDLINENPVLLKTSTDNKDANKVTRSIDRFYQNQPEPLKYDTLVTKKLEDDDLDLEGNCFEDVRSPEENAIINKIIDSNQRRNVPFQQQGQRNPLSQIEGNDKIEHMDDDGINPAYITYASVETTNAVEEVPDITGDENIPVIDVAEFTPQEGVTLTDGVNVNPKEYEGMESEYIDPQDISEIRNDPIDSTVSDAKIESFEKPKADPPIMKLEGSNITPQVVMYTQDTNELTKHDYPHRFENVETTQETIQATQDSSVEIENVADTQEIDTEPGDVFNQEEPAHQTEYAPESVENQWNTGQTKDIQHKEEYYYEGLHEQAETVHIDEHEETSTPYDQNYQQQYEQEQYNEMTQQQYDEAQYGQLQEDPSQYNYEASQYDQELYNQQTNFEQYNPETTAYVGQQYEQEYSVEQITNELDNEERINEGQEQSKLHEYKQSVSNT